MLNIITGRTGSGKTRYIRSLAAEIAENTSGKAVIIVPEQFSFETERGMLEILGNRKINNVEVLSFSRIAERFLSDYGKLTKKTADDGTRAVLMSLAIETLEDNLIFYNRYKKIPLLISRLLDFHREIKKCSITNEQLGEIANVVSKPSFASKLNELSMIFSCYDALLSQNFNDSCDYLDMLAELLQEVDYFKNKVVFLDAFSGFSGQEYKVIERILRQAEDVYVTFCCDTSKNNGNFELFYNANREIKCLKDIANKINVKIAPEKVLYAKKECKKDELNFLEENIFSSSNKVYEDEASAITVIPCRTKTEECQVVAAEIKKLVRKENLRYRDIAVIVRNEEDYKKDLASAFRKYDINCFHDNRQPVNTQPLIVFVKCLLDILSKGFNSETVFRLLKTQLYGFTVEEIAMLEDYCLMWKISSSKWKEEWNDNPDGLGKASNDFTKEKLLKINDLRERIVEPILFLKTKIKNGDGETISKELFAFLRNAKIDENLKTFTEFLKDNNEFDLALEQGRIWRLLTEIFDSLYFAIGKTTLSIERYSELWGILVASKNVGVIPNGIDEVIIGSADRIRASAPKVVFLMGVNTGVFPGESSAGVLFNDIERCELKNKGLSIISNLEYNSVSELFIAYHAATLSTDKLYLTYSAMASNSSSLTPSELVGEVLKLCPKCNVRAENLKIDLIESRKSAFSIMAGESVNGSVLGETLKQYFTENNGDDEINKLQKIDKRDFKIKDTDLATTFFGKEMYLSATNIEKFYNCPFEYFCEFGLKAKPRKEATIDAALSGVFIHRILEKFLLENPKDAITGLSDIEIKEKVEILVDDYIKSNMGGYTDKSKAFLRSVYLIKENIYNIILTLVKEFSQCDFAPSDFELNINNDGAIPTYEISLDNGGIAKITGSVDRVDTYEKDDKTFVRVIDYKTGGKDFELGEVFSGLNMQMLVYLFAIWQNGEKKYKNVTPAGVLYFQAENRRLSDGKITRNTDPLIAEEKLRKERRMQGVLLEDVNIVKAMENSGEGVFVPAAIDKKGEVNGNVISLALLGKLKDKVNNLIKNMAEELQSGNISALPVDGSCKWCSYKDVCKREENDAIKEFDAPSFADAIEMLRSDEDEESVD